MLILGIDPGYDRLGWAILSKEHGTPKFVDAGLIQTDKKESLQKRLHQIFTEIRQIIDTYHPDIAVIEELFFSNNQKTVIAVAQSRGVIIAALAEVGIEITEYTPPQIKAIVTGDGRADKKGVEKMVRLQLPGIPSRLIDDTLDAIAAALTYASDRSYG